MTNTSTPRTTLASTNARIDALVEAHTETLGLLGKLIAQMESNGQFATPAPVAQITDAPSKRTRKAKAKGATKRDAETFIATGVMSFANAATLVDAGADPNTTMVFGGKFGKGEPQTFADAKARREANEAKRAEYVAQREAGTLPERKGKTTAKASTKAPAQARSSKAAPANALLGASGPELAAMGTPEAQAEIERRAAKRAAKKLAKASA